MLACLPANWFVKMSGPVTSLPILCIYTIMYTYVLCMVVIVVVVVVLLVFTSLILKLQTFQMIYFGYLKIAFLAFFAQFLVKYLLLSLYVHVLGKFFI